MLWSDRTARWRSGDVLPWTRTGLLDNRPAVIVAASGGLPIGSPMDHASTWLQTFLGFLGISDVTTVAADGLNTAPELAIEKARSRIDDLDLSQLR